MTTLTHDRHCRTHHPDHRDPFATAHWPDDSFARRAELFADPGDDHVRGEESLCVGEAR